MGRISLSSDFDYWSFSFYGCFYVGFLAFGAKFASRPVLNDVFIIENPPISRVSAVNTSLTNQFIFDSFFNIKMARPMPMYSVPGSVDHF